MHNLEFEIDINAPKEKVWQTLWQDETYRKWTSAFSEGSYAKSNWNEGDRIQFLDPSGSGMYSVIDRKIDNEYMAFKHLGEVKEGKEVPPNENTERWAGAMETYTLTEDNGVTHLKATVDMEEDHVKYFNEAFPKAMQLVKEIAEE